MADSPSLDCGSLLPLSDGSRHAGTARPAPSPTRSRDQGYSALAHISPESLRAHLQSLGYKPSHAPRLHRAYLRGTLHEADLKLPAGLLEGLRSTLPDPGSRLAFQQHSTDGTTKLLLQFQDGRSVEAVLMPDFRPDRAAGCISSQVGCAMGCDFCATTKTGFERNLTTGEILEQYVALNRAARQQHRKLNTVVFMGMGEPMLNLANVIPAVESIADNQRGGLGCRQITVSTVGIVPGIRTLDDTGLNVNLAVSLHAPDDETRTRILPTGKHFPIADILAAADRFQVRRGRPVTIQYCLLKDINDAPHQAELLADWLKERRMHVNLLHYNATGLGLRGHAYEPSPQSQAEAFVAILRNRGISAHFRRSRGPDIDAACGQLRRWRISDVSTQG